MSTVFATNGEQYKKEVCFNIQPLEFANRASMSISSLDARNILKNMGYDIPSRITNGDMSAFLSNAPVLSSDEIMIFVQRAGRIQ